MKSNRDSGTSTGSDEERGVSSVIGAVLMVGVTVAVAAVAGFLFISFGQPVEDGVRAGASADIGNDAVTVNFVQAEDPNTEIEVKLQEITDRADGPMSTQTTTLADVGKTRTWEATGVSGLGDGDEVRVVVTAVNGDERAVVLDKTGEV